MKSVNFWAGVVLVALLSISPFAFGQNIGHHQALQAVSAANLPATLLTAVFGPRGGGSTQHSNDSGWGGGGNGGGGNGCGQGGNGGWGGNGGNNGNGGWGDCGNVGNGIETARREAGKDDLILVCGSLFTVGETKAWLDGQHFEGIRG